MLRTDVEVVVFALFQFVVASQDGGNLLNGLVGHVFGDGRAVDALQVGDGKDTFHDGCVGGQHHVVLVHAHTVVAFRLQHADDAEGDGVEADNLTHWVAPVGKQVVHYRLSHDAHLGGGLYVLVGKHLAILHGQLADGQVVLADTIDGRRRVVGTIDKPPRTVDARTDCRQELGLVANGVIVLQLEGLHGACVLSDTASHVGSRMNHNHVGTHLGDLRLDAFLRSLSDCQHGNHRGYANDDAEHRKEGSQLVVGECPQGYFE